MMEDVNIYLKEDVTSELKQYNLEKDANCLKVLIQSIKKSLNPFTESTPANKLFNISTGRSAKEDTENILLNVYEMGEFQKLQFIDYQL